MASPASFNWGSFGERIKDIDHDRRYMALFDLSAFLTKDGAALEDGKQKDMMDVVLGRLKDSHSDVQSQAVRVLGPLVKVVTKEDYVERAAVTLSGECLSGKKEDRDIASIALKAIVEVMPVTYHSAVRAMTTPLVTGLAACTDAAIKVEVIDILGNVVKSFGPVVKSDHERLQTQLITEMGSTKTSSRKVIACLSLLSQCTADTLFSAVVKRMLAEMQGGGTNQRKYIQLCNALSHTCGQRLGVFISEIMDLLLGELGRLQTTVDKSDAADEVRENILQAYESVLVRCPQQITPYVGKILAQCRELIKWDPNYDDDQTEEEDVEQQEDFEQQGGDEDDGISWRVRKAAAKCVGSVIETRPAALQEVYALFCSKASPTLPDRFRDRQEGVRLDIFAVFVQLLKKSYEQVDPMMNQQTEGGVTNSVSFLSPSFRAQYIDTKKEAEAMHPIGTQIVTSILSALKSPSVKVKCGCFQMLRELVIIAGPVLDETLYPDLVAAASKVLTDTSSRTVTPQLKLDALQFVLRLITATTFYAKDNKERTSKLCAKLCELSGSIFALTEDKHYLTVAEALRVCGELVRAVYLLDAQHPQRKAIASKLFKCVFSRMNAANVDRQVKETAIYTMSKVLRDLKGDVLAEDLTNALKVLGTLLGNETTRLMTVKTIHAAAKVDLPFTKEIVNSYLDSLAPFLRQVDVILRQHSISAIKSLLSGKQSLIQPDKYAVIVTEAIPLISDQDLNLAHLSLQLVTSAAPKVSALNAELTAATFKLVLSPLLQGHALESMEHFLCALFEHGKLKFDDITTRLIEGGKAVGTNKAVVANGARLLGAVVKDAGEKDKASAVAKLQALLGEGRSEADQSVAIQYIGEIGRRRVDVAGLLPLIKAKLETQKGGEELKLSAAIALGKCTPDVLALAQSITAPVSYLLLRATREAIVCADPLPFELLPILLALSSKAEEGTFNVLAESIGEMALKHPEKVVKEIANALKGADVEKRTVLLLAVKYTVTDQVNLKVSNALQEQTLATFLACLSKSEPSVSRRAAVLLLTALGHRRPILLHNETGVRGLQALYAETPVDQSLLKTVDLGPFKHTVDEGIDLRKAVFEGIDVLVDSAVMVGTGSLLVYANDFGSLVKAIAEAAGKDINGDIQQLCFGILVKLSKTGAAFTAMLSELDRISAGLKVTILDKKPDAKATDADRQKYEEILKSGLRALRAVSNIPSASEYPSVKDLLNGVTASATNGPIYATTV